MARFLSDATYTTSTAYGHDMDVAYYYYSARERIRERQRLREEEAMRRVQWSAQKCASCGNFQGECGGLRYPEGECRITLDRVAKLQAEEQLLRVEKKKRALRNLYWRKQMKEEDRIWK